MENNIEKNNLNRFKILLVGAGNLGSRYLQGLLEVKYASSIFVVDCSLKALKLCKTRSEEIKNKLHHINYGSSLPENINKFHLAIIATTSKNRASLIKKIYSKYSVYYWIIEKVIAQSVEELDDIYKLLGNSNNAWVNTPRRIMPWYKEIKNTIIKEKNKAIQVKIEGGNWGLACNSIHFIDLISWMKNTEVYKIESEEIKCWISSKREGYMEAIGCLKVSFWDGSFLKLICLENEEKIKIKFQTLNEIWEINEDLGIAKGTGNQIIKGQILLQSKLTSKIVDEILETGKTYLPKLQDSTLQHIKMIESFLESWNRIYKKNATSIKIT